MEKQGSANCFSESETEIANGKVYEDAGDILFNDMDPENAHRHIKNSVSGMIRSGEKLVCLGGDHSVTFPIIEAFAEKFTDLNILHLDAHADLYDNFDNNPFSHASPFARIMEQGKIKWREWTKKK